VLDPSSATPADRATRLLVDLLGQLRDALLSAVIEDEDLVEDARFIEKVDELLVALTNVRVDGDLELSVESERKDVQSPAHQLALRSQPSRVFS
jgi:hypothetical protein